MISLSDILVCATTFLLSVAIIQAAKGKRKNRLLYPPSFPTLPIFGSLPFIREFDALPEYFMKKSLELGPIFTVKFGSRLILVLNNLETIKDAFVRHASSFSGREGFYTEKYVVNLEQKGIADMNFNADFRRYRKLTMSILREFGFGSKTKTENLVLTEVVELVDRIKKSNGKAFDPMEMIVLSVSNVPFSMLLGKRRTFDEALSDIIVETRKFAEAMIPVLDFFPILQFFPPYNKKLAEIKRHSDALLMLIRKEANEILQDKSVDCFLRRYIDKEGENYDHEQLIFTTRDLILGSLETTSTALLWAFIFLANNPRVAKRAQDEIDSVIPKHRIPTSDDQAKLPFTVATILEVLRHRAPLSFAIPHLTLHDIEFSGCFIPANTVVIPNLKSAHMNPLDWPDAESFKPERFLDHDNKLINEDQVIAFSLGRRACPGEALARQQLFLFISGLLQNFSILPPEGTASISDEIIHGPTDLPFPFKIRMIPREI